jgi:tetratricopeptide (TPR) repeat protein
MTWKGLPDPIETVEVMWEPLAPSDGVTTTPLPNRLGLRPNVGVIGRNADLLTVNDAVKRVTAGEGREVILVSGEAGLGKSTLVAEAARVAFDAGACVLFGHCEEDLATPYQLFSEALGHYVTHAPEDVLLAHVAPHGSELVPLVPTLSNRIPELPGSKATDADTERYLLFSAVVGLLSMVSADQPVVLVLDDLQWADKGSLLLLRHVTSAEQATRVLVLATYRDNELSRSHPLLDTLAGLRRMQGVSRIELTGLDDTEVLALLEATAGHTMDDDGLSLARAVYRETDGNPFFVTEVLRNLSETGVIYQDIGGRWKSDGSLEHLALPDSVREVIGARVGRLGHDAEQALAMAAVIGRDFDLDLLARSTRMSEDALLDILDSAHSVALVRELSDAPGRYNFAHALIQQTLYDDLGPTRRARAHRQVAEALEDLLGDRSDVRVGELARHWFSATQPIDVTKAIGYSRQAGDAALRALAPADAVRYYSQALNLYAQANDPDPLLALDLAIGFGTAQRQMGDPAFRETLLGAARRAAELDDTERLVAAALANSRGFFSAIGTIDTAKIEILEMALDRLSRDSTDRALVLASLCAELAVGGILDRRQVLANEAIAVATSTGDDAALLRVYNLVHVPLAVPPLIEQSLIRSADALELAERVGDPVLLFFALGFRVANMVMAGMLDESRDYFEAQGSVAEHLDQPVLNWVHTWMSSLFAQIDGDFDEMERLAMKALQIGTDCGQPDAAIFFSAQSINVHWQRGTLPELLPMIEQLRSETPDFDPAFLAGLLAMVYVEADRIEDALGLLEQFALIDFVLPMDSLWLLGMFSYAEAATECNDSQYAGPLFDRLVPYAGLLCCDGGASVQGPVSHFLGGLATVLGRYDDAEEYFARAASVGDRLAAPFFAARTDLQWGKMLGLRHAPGDIDKARTLLTRAHNAASGCGYGIVERRAGAALQLLDA